MSLRARLLASYLALVSIFACIIGLVLLILIPSISRDITYQRLDTLARASVALYFRTDPTLTERRFEQLRQNLQRLAKEQDIRLLLIAANGQVLLDSAGDDATWNLLEQAQYQQRPEGLMGYWRQEGQLWLFVSRPWQIQQRKMLVIFAAPAPNRLRWFVDNLLAQFLLAGGIALALSALLAWLISRSVAKPLQELAGAAAAVTQGDYEQHVPISGPPQVRSLAANFNQMIDQVRSSQQAQRDFTSNVSHELKTPLTSVQGYSQAILDGTASDPAAVERAAQVIHAEAERMRRMITQLLDLARIESGQAVMRQSPVDIKILLETLVERLRPLAENAGVNLTAEIPHLPLVKGDGDWLSQVFGNLIDNALKHTAEGGRVMLAAETIEPADKTGRRGKGATSQGVQVTVMDNGAGIPPEDLPRIFERFYQVDKSRKKSGSVGLGLAIAQEVVQAHGGQILVESVVDLGSRFTVILPLDETSQV